MNGVIYIFCGIPKFVVASAAGAKFGDLFINYKEGKIVCLILKGLGHKQSPAPIHCDNGTATVTANDTVKKQCSRSI